MSDISSDDSEDEYEAFWKKMENLCDDAFEHAISTELCSGLKKKLQLYVDLARGSTPNPSAARNEFQSIVAKDKVAHLQNDVDDAVAFVKEVVEEMEKALTIHLQTTYTTTDEFDAFLYQVVLSEGRMLWECNTLNFFFMFWRSLLTMLPVKQTIHIATGRNSTS